MKQRWMLCMAGALCALTVWGGAAQAAQIMPSTAPREEKHERHLQKIREMLDFEVKEGKITQRQADQIYADAEKGDFSGLRERKLVRLKEWLDTEVKEGRLTKEQADKLYKEAEQQNFSGLREHFGKKRDKKQDKR